MKSKLNTKTYFLSTVIIFNTILAIFVFSSCSNTSPANQDEISTTAANNTVGINSDEHTYTPTPSPSPSPTPFEIKYKSGLFSWNPYTKTSNNREELHKVISALEIDEVYQYFERIDYDDIEAYNMAVELNELGVDLYILAGSSDWTYTPDGQPMIDEIERALKFRKNWGDDSLKGIVFDIEPYDSKRWLHGRQDELMANYISGMKAAYEKAHENNLRIIICIPYWYDENHNETLQALLNYCDEISVMNYNRLNEYDNMKNEIEYARQYDKSITCIFEFQAVGLHNLTDEQTYNNIGIDAAVSSFETIYEKAHYKKLKFAYHYLSPLSEMLADQTQ